jgi:hypothetical protein
VQERQRETERGWGGGRGGGREKERAGGAGGAGGGGGREGGRENTERLLSYMSLIASSTSPCSTSLEKRSFESEVERRRMERSVRAVVKK